MEYNRIYDLLSDAVSGEDTTQNLIDELDQIKSELDTKYWSSNKLNTQLNDLYGKLNQHQQQLISSQRQELQSLYSSEEKERTSLKAAFRNVVPSQSEEVIKRESDQLLRQVIAAKNVNRRQSLEKDLRVALDDLHSDLKVTNFDLTSAKMAIAEGDENRLSGELNDFSTILKNRGWDTEDLESMIDDAKESGTKPTELLEELENRTEITFTFLVRLPVMSVRQSYSATNADFSIVAPNDFDINDIPRIDSMTRGSDEKEHFQKIFDSDPSIKFQVDAFGFEEANKRSIDKISTFLDSCAGIDQAAYLEDLQYQNGITFFCWWSNQGTQLKYSISRNSEPSASLSQNQLEHVEELYSIAQLEKPITDRLSRAAHYLRKGNIAYRDIDAAVNYIACLETLTTDSNSVRDEVYDNTLRFARVRPSAKQEFVNTLDRLYNVRNAALHSGSNREISESDISLIRMLVSRIIWRMVDFANQDGGGTLSDYTDFVEKDIRAKYQYLVNKIVDSGLQLDQQYTVSGKAVNVGDTTYFGFSTDIEFIDEGHYICIDVECSNIRDTWNSIRDDLALDIQLDPISGTQIELGSVNAGRFYGRNSISFEFRDFDTL